MDIAPLIDYAKDPLIRHYISVIMVAYPVAIIFARAGFSKAWALMLFIPYIGIVLCAGYLALSRWPQTKIHPVAEGK